MRLKILATVAGLMALPALAEGDITERSTSFGSGNELAAGSEDAPEVLAAKGPPTGGENGSVVLVPVTREWFEGKTGGQAH